MRTQEQREEQTLAIGSAVLVAAVLWFAPLVVVTAVAGRFAALDAAVRVAFPVALVAFVVTVVVRLRARVPPRALTATGPRSPPRCPT